MEVLLDRVPWLVALWLSLAVHEWAHAAAADALGDDTARLLGRKSLDPFAHIDPVGTFLLPLLGVPFGWAVPVPVQPHRFRVFASTGLWLTAAAGPASNLVVAVLAAGLYRVFIAVGPSVAGIGWLLETLVPLNLSLALFNLLPIPPLDGSRIVDAHVPYHLRASWVRVRQFAPVLLIGTIFLLEVVGFGPFRAVFRASEWMLRG